MEVESADSNTDTAAVAVEGVEPGAAAAEIAAEIVAAAAAAAAPDNPAVETEAVRRFADTSRERGTVGRENRAGSSAVDE